MKEFRSRCYSACSSWWLWQVSHTVPVGGGVNKTTLLFHKYILADDVGWGEMGWQWTGVPPSQLACPPAADPQPCYVTKTKQRNP